MHSTKSAITHHDVTVFEIDRMVTNIKIWISKERNMTFPRNEKILKFSFKDSTFRRHHFFRHHLLHKFWHTWAYWQFPKQKVSFSFFPSQMFKIKWPVTSGVICDVRIRNLISWKYYDNKLGIKKTGIQWNPVITKKTVRKILLIDKKTGENEHNMKQKYLLRNP